MHIFQKYLILANVRHIPPCQRGNCRQEGGHALRK
jgi:hypothetical protein